MYDTDLYNVQEVHLEQNKMITIALLLWQNGWKLK